MLIELYEYLSRQLMRINRKVVELSRTDKYRGRVSLLCTVLGVGLLIGMAILVELQAMRSGGRVRDGSAFFVYFFR